MDGFRDRMNRGTSERGSYDRYERSSRRSSYSAAPQPGVSADEIAQLMDESNGKQLDVINDLFEDAKDDRFESEKQILSAIDDLIATINSKETVVPDDAADEEVEVSKDTEDDAKEALIAEILRTVTSNSDLLAEFAEEQLPMLIRGNSTVLNQIREDIAEQGENIKRLSDDVERNADKPASVPVNIPNNEEVLNAAATNNALLNALRSEVAGIQAEIRSQAERMAANADDESPLDNEDVLTKAKAEEWYKSLDETIHADCVKVYRNVQKLMEEQNSGSGDDIKKSIGGLKALTIFNLVLLIINLAAVVSMVLGILP